MKTKFQRAKQFARDHAVEVAAVGTGIVIGVYGYNAVHVLMRQGSPKLDINDADIQTLLSNDCRIVFETPVANLILHAEPLA